MWFTMCAWSPFIFCILVYDDYKILLYLWFLFPSLASCKWIKKIMTREFVTFKFIDEDGNLSALLPQINIYWGLVITVSNQGQI